MWSPNWWSGGERMVSRSDGSEEKRSNSNERVWQLEGFGLRAALLQAIGRSLVTPDFELQRCLH